MLRFSANLGFLWRDLPLLERIARASDAGFRAVELHWPYDTPAAEVRAACEARGVALLSVNAPCGDRARGEFGLGALPGRQAEFRQSIDDALRWAAESGASMIHVLAGVVPPGERDAGRRVLLDNLHWALDTAETQGVPLLLEAINHHDQPGYFYSRPREAASVIADIGRPGLRLMFDCYHSGMEGEDVAAEFLDLLPLIGHVQIAGVPGRAEPDGGTMDYRTVFSAIDTSGYAGWIGCEYAPRGSVERGLGWMTPYRG